MSKWNYDDWNPSEEACKKYQNNLEKKCNDNHKWTDIGPAGIYCPKCGIFYDTHLKRKREEKQDKKEKETIDQLKNEINELKEKINQLEMVNDGLDY